MQRRQKTVRCFLATVLGVGLWTVSTRSEAVAMQQNEIAVAVANDGTGPFTADDPLDPGDGSAHTPGQDENANNGVVRTLDTVTYRIDLNVNEFDATGVVLAATLPDGATWVVDPTTTSGLPAGCVSGSITGNAGRDLLCDVDDAQPEGSNGVIFAVALVGNDVLLEGSTLDLTATVASDQLPAVTSNTVSTVVSSAPLGDWKKGEEEVRGGGVIDYTADEIYYDVDNGGVLGRVYLWSVRLEAAGGGRGSERILDATPIQFFDHGFDLTPSAVLATGLVPDGRTACGWYDGAESYPSSTVGMITCTDATGTSPYPIQQIDITGHDTQNPPAANADVTPNTDVLLSAQVAYWMPESELFDAAQLGTKNIQNAISGSIAAVSNLGDGITPIQIAGIGGPVDEVATANNVARDEYEQAPPTLPGQRGHFHWVRFQNGPYQHLETTERSSTGMTYRTYDRRYDGNTGTGPAVADLTDPDFTDAVQRWDGNGKVARNITLTITQDMVTFTQQGGPFADAVASCMTLDPTHMELVPLPATYPVFLTEGTPGAALPNFDPFQGPSISQRQVAPSTSIVDVIAGNTANNLGFQGTVGWGVSTNLGTPADVFVEVAAAQAVPGGATQQFNTTCNQSDADGRGWVAASDTAGLAVFDGDSNGTYEGITLIRVRSDGPVEWTSPASVGTRAFGWQVNLQVQVKSDPVAQAEGQELFVHSSRAWGDWDPTVDDQPPTTDCFSGAYRNAGGVTDPLARFDSTTGWCNLVFEDDGASSTDLTDTPDDYDDRAWEATLFTPPRASVAHTDAVSIVDAQVGVSKANVDGDNDINANGDLVEFEVRPAVSGAPFDTVNNIRIVDTLISNYEFVGITLAPSTAGSTCGYTDSDRQIRCTFGNQPGGWNDVVRYQVRVVDSPANVALRNEVVIAGDDPITSQVLPTSSAFAYSYTPGPAAESAILKGIDQPLGACPRLPAEITDSADCSLTTANGSIEFGLDVVNEGNEPLVNYRLIDVLPFNGDDTEPASATGVVGDGRTPASDFGATRSFEFLTGTVVQQLFTADPPDTVSRDPEVSEVANTWCDAPSGGTAVFGTGTCPNGHSDVTAVYANLGDIGIGETRTLRLGIRLTNGQCDDIVTNTFGARTDTLELPIRSNDVSAMVGCIDLAVEKSLAAGQSGTLEVGESVIFDIAVDNQGPDAAVDFDLTDHLPAWLTYVSDTNTHTAAVDGQDITWTYGVMSNGGSDSFQLTAVVNALPFATTTNFVEITRAEQGDIDSSPADDNPVTSDTDNDGVPDTTTGDPTGPTNPPNEDDEASASVVVQFGDIIFDDTNANGIQDPGELLVAGVVVELRDQAGDPVLDAGGEPVTATTGDDGLYLFTVLPGISTARFDPTTLPAGTEFTVQAAGGDTAVDSDADSITGVTGPIDLSDPTVLADDNGDGIPDDLTIDAGIVRRVRIGDFVFRDNNNDGQQSPGEPGVPDIVVNLLDANGDPVPGPDGQPSTTTTGPGGEYGFDVTPGAYQLQFEYPDGFIGAVRDEGNDRSDSDATATGRITLVTVGTEDDLTLDVGIVPLQRVSGVVWTDTDRDGNDDPEEPRTPGSTVTIRDESGTVVGTVVTGDDGTYEFEVPPGDFTITIDPPPGLALTITGGDSDADRATGVIEVTVVAGTDVGGLDAGVIAATAPLPTTGSTPLATLWLGLGALLAGLIATIGSRQRRAVSARPWHV